ncbi:hypothetical protein, partial [Mesorhizobium sp. M1E.F.Ca.ET.063.01.1.1]|uniref:hypothetical protein n=1 Tax=Mesorhizobium sp. M1E.F.Ca.ET.063.01.1.1 TaxID=2496750 RepID=UPI001AECE89A
EGGSSFSPALQSLEVATVTRVVEAKEAMLTGRFDAWIHSDTIYRPTSPADRDVVNTGDWLSQAIHCGGMCPEHYILLYWRETTRD